MDDWYDRIEEPVRNLVKLLRNNGFNTICSCGHLPQPYVQMIQTDDSEVTMLHNLLRENKYTNFIIRTTWDTITNQRTLEVTFYIQSKLVQESNLREP